VSDPEEFRRAAQAEIERLLRGERPRAEPVASRVTRLLLDVEIDGRPELVSISSQSGAYSVQSTGERREEALRAALVVLSGSRSIPDPVPSLTPPAGLRASMPGTLEAIDPYAELRVLCDDLVLSVVRAGVRDSDRAPAVKDAIDRLVKAAGDSAHAGVGRFVGRLREAIAMLDVDRVAALLEALARVSAALDEHMPNGAASALFGIDSPAPRDVSDRTLVEVGREHLAGVVRREIERRYLLDLDSGEVFREDRVAARVPASVGPCPRVISVGLAEIDEGPAPPRIRLLQYAVSSEPTGEQWTAIDDLAMRNFGDLWDLAAEARSKHAGLAEPAVVLRPKSVEVDDGVVLQGADSVAVPIARASDPATEQAIGAFVESRKVAWVSGRLVETDGAVLLAPCMVAVEHESGRPSLLRLT
jgi:hypothetical protein